MTLAGQSAGSITASILATATVAAGLFTRLILESGVATAPVWTALPRDAGLAIGRKVLSQLGVADVAGLQQLPATGGHDYCKRTPCLSGACGVAVLAATRE